MTYRLRNIGIAVALAAVAALLTVFYVTNYKRTVQEGEKDVKVYVAAKDIPAGTSGEDVIARDLLTAQDVDKRNVAPGAISTPEQIEELVAVEDVYAGEQVTTRRFAAPEERGIRAELKGNLRAMQLPGEAHQVLAGELNAGDHVDVVGSWKYPEDSQNHVSRVILRDLLVLEAAKTSGTDQKLTKPGGSMTVTLALTDAQSQKLFYVSKHGDWSLQLRPTEDDADSPESAEDAGTLLFDGLSRGEILKKLQSLKPERSSR